MPVDTVSISYLSAGSLETSPFKEVREITQWRSPQG